MTISHLALLSALLLSAVSGYFSVVGLMALFSGAAWQIAIMGGALEVSKLVTASWLYRNWHEASTLLKTYLTACVVVLILITSLGTFGFLSRAHIEQQTNSSVVIVQENIAIVASNVEQKTLELDDINKQIAQIDDAIRTLTGAGQASKSLKAQKDQKKLRDELVTEKNVILTELTKLKTDKIKLESEVKKNEAELGPLKYVAEVIYGADDAKNHVDSAVRFIILILVGIFDPLAVVLLIAANNGLRPKQVLTQPVVGDKVVKTKPTKKKKQDDWLASSVKMVDENDILNIK
jgi:hypothetical protein